MAAKPDAVPDDVLRTLETLPSEDLEINLTDNDLQPDLREPIKQILKHREEKKIREEERIREEEETRRLEDLKSKNPKQYDVEMEGKERRKEKRQRRQRRKSEAERLKETNLQWLAEEQQHQQELETMQQELKFAGCASWIVKQLQEVEEAIQASKRKQAMWKGAINNSDKELQQVALERDEESQKLLDEAMKKGYIEAQLCKCLLEGLAGAGKSALKRLLLGMAPAILRVSTGCLERPIRAVSGMRVKVSEKRWRELTIDELLITVADAIPLLRHRIKAPKTLHQDEDPNTSNDTQDEPTAISVPQPEATPTQATQQGNSPDARQATDPTSSCAKLAISTILKNIADRIAREKESGRLFSIPIVHFMDTGGQTPFHEVISIFSKHNSVAVIVFRLSERLDARPMVEYYDASGQLVGTPRPSPLTCEQVVKVMARSLQSSRTGGKLAKVIVVGTHKDKESECSSETREQKNEKLCSVLCPIMQDELVFYGESFKELIFPVNAIGRGEEEERIAKLLRQEIEKCNCKVKIPIWWFILELILRHLAQQLNRSVLSRQECLEVAGLLNFHENAFDAALEFLNDLNILLYYPKILPGVVFTDLQVPVDKVNELTVRKYQLQKAKEGMQVQAPQEAIPGKFKKFRDQGIVAIEFLSEFPQHYVDGLFTPDDLVELFTKLLIFAPISHDEYFMPILLETLSDDELEKHHIFSSAALPLLVHFPNGWPPYGIFCCLVVYLMNECQWKVAHSSGVPILVSKNCIKFKLPDSTCCVTLIDSVSCFEIHVDAPPLICHRYCPSIKNSVFTGIDIAAKNHGYNDALPKPAIFCRAPHSSDTLSSLHVAEVNDYPYWMCTESSLYGELIEPEKVWFKEQDSNSVSGAQEGQIQSPVQSFPIAASANEAIQRNTETQKTEQCSVTATATGDKPRLAQLMMLKTAEGEKVQIIKQLAPDHEWKDFGIYFDFDPDGQTLKLIETEQKLYGPIACCQAMFQHWLAGNGVTASWDTLIELLEDAERPHLAEQIKSALNL